LYVNGVAAVKASVVDAIKLRQLTSAPRGTNQQNPAQDQIHKPCVAKAAGAFARHTMAGSQAQQMLKYSTIQDWCCGSLSDVDPMALPYRLAIARFCPERDGDVADEFDEALFDFRLSHSAPVPVPTEDLGAHSKDMPCRAEVLLVRDVYRHCVTYRRFRLANQELLELCPNMPNGMPIWRRLGKALDALSEESWLHGGVEQSSLGDLLQKVFPKAQTKHLRMFEAWCSEYDSLSDSRVACCELEQAAAVYANNELKPLLPVEDLEVLEREFDRLDCSRNGYILPMDIVRGWKWTEEQAIETVAAHDIHGLGRIEKTGFVKMMCQVEFRSPEMNGVGRELFGELIASQAAGMRLDLNTRESQYSVTAGDQPLLGTLFVPPTTALPEVSEAAWAQWNAVFDSLDKDGDDQIVTKDLLEAGLLSEPVCHSVIRLIDPEVEGSFSRLGFLQALLRAHRCQHPQKHRITLQQAK
jgi:hypothetical protein